MCVLYVCYGPWHIGIVVKEPLMHVSPAMASNTSAALEIFLDSLVSRPSFEADTYAILWLSI